MIFDEKSHRSRGRLPIPQRLANCGKGEKHKSAVYVVHPSFEDAPDPGDLTDQFAVHIHQGVDDPLAELNA